MLLKNKVIMAAAGAGKTYGICYEVINILPQTLKKVLIVTYTNKGVESIKSEYQKQNSGVIDANVDIKTWYQFLLADLIKPYQRCIMGQENLIRSLDFSQSYGKINYKRRGTKEHYINKHYDVLSNAACELAVDCNTYTNGKVVNRLEEVYSHIYIDEIQDIAGEDFTLLNLLFESLISITCVGDYKQATFKTNNGRKNKSITGNDILDYFILLDRKKIIELIFNKKSRRFNQRICDFSNSIFSGNTDIIETIVTEKVENEGVYLLHYSDMYDYIVNYNPIILKYDQKTNTFGYTSYNFGQCKGMTFNRVLVVPNKPFLSFLKDGVALSAPSKYYVASTRAKYSLVFVVDKLFENERFQYSQILLEDKKIDISIYNKQV